MNKISFWFLPTISIFPCISTQFCLGCRNMGRIDLQWLNYSSGAVIRGKSWSSHSEWSIGFYKTTKDIFKLVTLERFLILIMMGDHSGHSVYTNSSTWLLEAFLPSPLRSLAICEEEVVVLHGFRPSESCICIK